MMLDTKSEQKWPLIGNREGNPVKGHFFFIALREICGKIEEKGVKCMILHNGRPEDCSTRLPKEIKVYDLLDSLENMGLSTAEVDIFLDLKLRQRM